MPDASSGIWISVCGLLVGAAFLACLFMRDWPRQRYARHCIALATISTILLVCGTIKIGANRLGDVRLGLTEVRFAIHGDQLRSIRIGGSKADDDLVVGGRAPGDLRLHAGALTIDTAPAPRTGAPGVASEVEPDPAIQLHYHLPGDDSWTGVVMIKRLPADWLGRQWERVIPAPPRFLNAINLESNSLICVPAGNGRYDQILFDEGGLKTNGAEAVFVLPQRASDVAPLRDFAAVRGAGGVIRRPASRSFITRASGSWQVVMLDRGGFVNQGGARCDAARPTPYAIQDDWALKPGDRVALTLAVLDMPDTWQLEAAAEDKAETPPRSRLVTRRSLTLSVERDRDIIWVLARFDTPETMRVASASIEGQASRDVTLSFAAPAPAQREALGDMAQTQFRTTGDRLAQGLRERLRLTAAAATRVGYPNSSIVEPGSVFTVGKEDGDAELRVMLERLDLDWYPLAGLQILAIAALAATSIATWRWRSVSKSGFLLLGLLDFLLGFRLLAAVEAAVIDPRPSIIQSVPASLLALALVPFIVAAFAPASVLAAEPRRRVVVHAALILAIIVYVNHFGGQVRLVPQLLLTGCVIALVYRLKPDWRGRTFARAADIRGLDRVRVLMMRSAVSGGRVSWSPALRTMTVAAILLSVRIVLPERVPLLGSEFSIAILYTPLVVAYLAYGFRAAACAVEAGGTPSWNWIVWATLLVLPLFWAGWAKDDGYAILGVVVTLLLAALLWIWTRVGEGRKGLPFLVPALLAATLCAWVAIFPPSIESQWPKATSPTALAERKALIDESLQWKTWYQRVLGYVAPGKLAQAGTREANELNVALQQMAEYSNQGLFGRGYFNQPEPTELQRYQLSDNVAAIHLLTPFGRLGTAVFLLVIGLVTAGCTWLAATCTAGRPPPYRVMLSLISLWVLFGASSYMILANLGLVPFTGRNVYLLAASSISDLIEGVTLIAIALVGLTGLKARR